MSLEERELDRQWQALFGQPLPMLGCADIVRSILTRYAAAEANVGPPSQEPARSSAGQSERAPRAVLPYTLPAV